MKFMTNLACTLVLGCAIVAMSFSGSTAQERGNKQARPSPNAAVSQNIGTTVIDITYGRPGVKGREIFGGLQPYGEVWRAGANESTVITFSNDVSIEGPVSYTHLRAHETDSYLVCRLL